MEKDKGFGVKSRQRGRRSAKGETDRQKSDRQTGRKTDKRDRGVTDRQAERQTKETE